MSNTLGNIFKITSFGESHGKVVGVIIDGCPANISIDINHIQDLLDKRKPGQSNLTTSRSESDEVEILSGIFEGKTTGHPICLQIQNKDHKSKDYDALKEVYRPSHADLTYDKKYQIRDHRGGGRASARITAGWVAAGAIAMQVLQHFSSIEIAAYVTQVHDKKLLAKPIKKEIDQRYHTPTRCPQLALAQEIETAILQAKEDGDSLGGVIQCIINNVPVGLGDPVFSKLHAQLGQAMLSIPAVKGFEIGAGFDSVLHKGSELNDFFVEIDGEIQTETNHSGGVQGGISNGMPVEFRVAFKPTSTISKEQKTVNTAGENITLEAKGRHDPCVVPRAVPIVEALSAIVLLDHFLFQKVMQ